MKVFLSSFALFLASFSLLALADDVMVTTTTTTTPEVVTIPQNPTVVTMQGDYYVIPSTVTSTSGYYYVMIDNTPNLCFVSKPTVVTQLSEHKFMVSQKEQTLYCTTDLSGFKVMYE